MSDEEHTSRKKTSGTRVHIPLFGDKYSIFGFRFVEMMILNLRYFMDFGLKSIFLGGLVYMQ